MFIEYLNGEKITVIDLEYITITDLKEIGDLGIATNKLQAIIPAYKNGFKKLLKVFDLSRDILDGA